MREADLVLGCMRWGSVTATLVQEPADAAQPLYGDVCGLCCHADELGQRPGRHADRHLGVPRARIYEGVQGAQVHQGRLSPPNESVRDGLDVQETSYSSLLVRLCRLPLSVLLCSPPEPGDLLRHSGVPHWSQRLQGSATQIGRVQKRILQLVLGPAPAQSAEGHSLRDVAVPFPAQEEVG